jgi:hypothetical protein
MYRQTKLVNQRRLSDSCFEREISIPRYRPIAEGAFDPDIVDMWQRNPLPTRSKEAYDGPC